jgi:ribosomal protein S18 acetylase RimI-like enzyme
METVIKRPRECTKAELDIFEQLVSKGGEVSQVGLRNRILLAEKLIFIIDGSCVAVGAIKNPNSGYKTGVFQKAEVSDSYKYKFELGWLYVIEAGRGNGYGRLLMESVMAVLSDNACFATTRENNEAMQHIFSCFGFSRIGHPYESNAGDYSLVLYGKS